MDHEALAKRIVALGVGQAHPKGGVYYLSGAHSVSADEFTHSWEVAGALMEKCENIEIRSWLFDANNEPEPEEDAFWQVLADGKAQQIKEAQEKSLPHAIILACVEALEAASLQIIGISG